MPPTKSPAATLAWTALKLALCGAVICSIAFAVAVLGTTGTVTESHADITWFSPFERSNTDRFTRSLETLGHRDHRRYDLNGNVVFFSATTSRKQPQQLMAEYQEEFRRQGLNDEIFVDLSPEQRIDRRNASLTGSIVPYLIDADRIVLRGVVPANNATDLEELAQVGDVAHNRHQLFKGHRHVEFLRPRGARRTEILASWSDENFDYSKMIPGSQATGHVFDEAVPACPGCIRLTRFADDNPDDIDRTEIVFAGPHNLEMTRHFYHDALQARGWQRSPLNDALRPIEDHLGKPLTDAHSDRYLRDGQAMTLTLMPDEDSGMTLVFASLVGR